MKAQSFYKNKFLSISFIGSVKDLFFFLKDINQYNDGQGRSFDILDEELSYE